jgi:hypothetical protein
MIGNLGGAPQSTFHPIFGSHMATTLSVRDRGSGEAVDEPTRRSKVAMMAVSVNVDFCDRHRGSSGIAMLMFAVLPEGPCAEEKRLGPDEALLYTSSLSTCPWKASRFGTSHGVAACQTLSWPFLCRMY